MQRECQRLRVPFAAVMMMLIDRWLEHPEVPGDEGEIVRVPLDRPAPELIPADRPAARPRAATVASSPPAPPPPAPAAPRKIYVLSIGEGRPRLISEQEVKDRALAAAPAPGDRAVLCQIVREYRKVPEWIRVVAAAWPEFELVSEPWRGRHGRLVLVRQ